jgi:DNA invertase Pin-like site-specific DNA recombinase
MTAALWHFANLTRDQQADVIRRMANEGHSETTIATATGLSVELIRRVIGEREQRHG